MTPPLSPAVAPAVAPVALAVDTIDEARWTAWKTRGQVDRAHTAARMRVLAVVVAVGLAGWLTRAILAIP